MKLLLYCTKAKPYLTRNDLPNERGEFYKHWQLGGELDRKHLYGDTPILNGKIVAECDFEVEKIFEDNFEDARDGYVEHFYTLKSYDDFDEGQEVLLKESCLQKHELSNYLGFENGYAIHIKNLHVFDEPRELSDYEMSSGRNFKQAPQNMSYAYIKRGGWECCDIKVLISIKPEWLCKILNKEKTIEVRKKVLKEMLDNE